MRDEGKRRRWMMDRSKRSSAAWRHFWKIEFLCYAVGSLRGPFASENEPTCLKRTHTVSNPNIGKKASVGGIVDVGRLGPHKGKEATVLSRWCGSVFIQEATSSEVGVSLCQTFWKGLIRCSIGGPSLPWTAGDFSTPVFASSQLDALPFLIFPSLYISRSRGSLSWKKGILLEERGENGRSF